MGLTGCLKILLADLNRVRLKMTNKKDYLNKCFSPNWIEVDLESAQKKELERADYDIAKEVCLEGRQRKDLDTLIRELDEIKQNIERVAEKQHRLANLMSFYSGEFAQ